MGPPDPNGREHNRADPPANRDRSWKIEPLPAPTKARATHGNL